MIGSEFQARVWHALTKIPYGKTISYGEIAREVNSPKAVRAVGGTVGANLFFHHHPVSPRRRREWFSITGYGGGYAAKRHLLALELGLSADELPFSRGVKE